MMQKGELRAVIRLERGGGATRTWYKTSNEKLGDLYATPPTIRAIQPRAMKWAEHIKSKG